MKHAMSRAEAVTTALVALVVLVVPLAMSGSEYSLGLFGYTFCLGLFALSLWLMLSLTGEIPLGHALYYGLGAYGSSLLMMKLEWPFLVSVIVAMLACGAVAAIIGAITLRLSGAYFAVVSWGLSGVAVIAATNLTGLTGGELGLFGVPNATIGPVDLADPVVYPIVTGVVLLIALLGVAALRASRLGSRLSAGRLNPRLARSVGHPVHRDRVVVFMVSSMLASLAGALAVTYLRIVSPDTLSVFTTVASLLMVLMGGVGFLAGPVLGALFFQLAPELLHMDPELRLVTFAVLIIVIMLRAPGGLPEVFWRLSRLWRRRQSEPASVEESAPGHPAPERLEEGV